MARPGTVIIREGKPVKVEFTDDLNLLLTDEALESYIYINLSDAEVKQIVDKINAYPAYRDARRAEKAKEG